MARAVLYPGQPEIDNESANEKENWLHVILIRKRCFDIAHAIDELESRLPSLM